jgi:hypothetical protein
MQMTRGKAYRAQPFVEAPLRFWFRCAAVTHDNHSRSLWRPLTSAGLFLHQSKMKIGRAKFLRFEFNRRIAGAGVSESLVCTETLRRKFRRPA